MMDPREQRMKEKILESLMDYLTDNEAGRMKPKGLGVEVQAPDKEKLQEGLDKAKDLVGKADMPEGMDAAPHDEDSDEQRLMDLLGDDDDDDKKGF